MSCQRHTVGPILFLSYGSKAVELVVPCSSTLEAMRVAAILVECSILALPLRNVLLHLAEAIARHVEFSNGVGIYRVVCAMSEILYRGWSAYRIGWLARARIGGRSCLVLRVTAAARPSNGELSFTACRFFPATTTQFSRCHNSTLY
jgi:hypothetical protein